MNLTNSTDTLEPTGQVPYKTETTADMHLYYQVSMIRLILMKHKISLLILISITYRITLGKLTRLATDSFLPFSTKMIYSWWIWPLPTVNLNNNLVKNTILSNLLLNFFSLTAMYPPRLLDNQPVNHSLGLAPTNSGGNAVASIIPSTVIDTTSDSAVSSMGSERGPSISDGDWIDTSNATDSNTTSVTGATAVLPSGSAYGMEYSSGYR